MLLLGLAVLLASPQPAPHPDSLSSSRIRVLDSEAHLTIRCQVLSLEEVIEGLDANGDGSVSADEVDTRRDEILAYVSKHYVLEIGSNRELEGGSPLAPEPRSLLYRPPGSEGVIGKRRGSVDLDYAFLADSPIEDLLVEVSLFRQTSPDHIDILSLEWNEEEPRTYSLVRDASRIRYDPEGRGALPVFVRLGWRHILAGWDHLAFLVALILGTRLLRTLVGVVTAFTIAHSATLALVALEVVDVSAYGDLIESAIALSIAYVATDNLVHEKRKRSHWIEAFGFGLIHGLGFATFLGQSLVSEQSKVTALFGFNVGVEGGQLLVIFLVTLLLSFIKQRDESGERFLAPRLLRRVGSVTVAALGFYWFVQRI